MHVLHPNLQPLFSWVCTPRQVQMQVQCAVQVARWIHSHSLNEELPAVVRRVLQARCFDLVPHLPQHQDLQKDRHQL